jgi:hypothetical protein
MRKKGWFIAMHDKSARVRILSLFLIILFGIFMIGGAFAIFAFPSASGSNTVLAIQSCNNESRSGTADNYSLSCNPSLINLNENTNFVTNTAGNNQYMGVNMSAFNSSITNCGSITNVRLCWEWWTNAGGALSAASSTVAVDADGGASYTIVQSGSNPGSSANPGEICLDVTGSETWACSDFFGSSGTMAKAKLQVQQSGGTAKTLTVDTLYFNVTYVSDAIPPAVSIVYPTNTTYSSNVTTLNFTSTDTSGLSQCWYNFNGTNITTSCTSGVQVNITGLNSNLGSNTWYVWSNDTSGLVGNANITFSYDAAPTISNITVSPNPSGLGASVNITANGVSDSSNSTLQFYCSDVSASSVIDNIMCSAGNISNLANPYFPYCTYTPNRLAGNYTVYCRMYDGVSYSSTVNYTYTISANTLSLTVLSIAGDSAASYFDTVNDNKADVLVNGSVDMLCKWFTTDLGYTSSGTSCSVNSSGVANCSITTTSQGAYNRYISCQDKYGNSQTSSDNLDLSFTLDYTAPTTNDSSISSVQPSGYSVTITEADNVDSSLTIVTQYCKDTANTCIPNLGIDNSGQVTFTTRGVNYLRYNSTDAAGNNQSIQSKTININQLPTFTSASDNAVSILGGTTVTITTVSSDSDSGQNLKLYVCNSSGITSSGCTGTQYCSASATANLSCGFASETDTATHTWYAYIMDVLNESATTNPLTGFYSTDSSGPTITINDPQNTTYTQSSVSAQITTSEITMWAGYSLDDAANVTMTNLSMTQFTATISSLSLGQHNITYYANDSFGNMGVSAVRYFTIAASVDLIAPTITIVTPTNLSYTTLTPLLNITSDESLGWAGYTLNGGNLTNLTNTSLTSWNATLSLSQETTNTVIIYANDTNNNQASKTITLYADSRAPRYSSVSAPSTNQSLPVNCSIAWVDAFALTNVLIGENSSGSFENHTIALTSNGTASYVIVGSKLANAGTYSCQFYATDAAGNTNTTSTTFTISDVIAPTVTVTSPGNFTYNQNSIGISLVTNENASAAWYSLNGAANVSMSNTSKTNWNATLTSLSNAGYNIRFYANDSSGNIGSSSLIYFTVNSISDTISPVITMINPTNLSYKGLSLVLNISSNEALLWAGYTLNGGNLTNLTNTSTTSWNATLSGLTQESTNTIIIYANDTSNNQANSAITFYSDTIAPRYSNPSAPSANQSQSVNCSIAWVDAFALTNVIIGENSSGSFENHTIALTSNGTASYVIVGSKLTNAGTYTCQFYATDAAENINTTSTTFTISDVIAPTVTVTSPTNGGVYGDTSVLLSLVTNENASAAWFNNGTANVSMGNTSNINWNYSFTGVNLQTYVFIFYANDSSGNVGVSGTKTFNITIGTDSVPPVVTINTIANASYKSLSGVALNVTTNENVSWVKYSLNGTANVSMTNTTILNWNATLVNLVQESTNSLIVYANDTAGNIGATSIIFYADTLAPRISSASATSVNETQNVNCSAYITDSFNLSSVKIAENTTGSFVNHTIDTFSTGFANYTIYNVIKGSYTCQFYATDAAGNTNTTSAIFTVSDVTAPTITVTSPSNSTYGGSSVSASISTSESASSAWYSLDSGFNSSLSGSGTSWSTTLNALSVGSHNVIFYANDSSGNLGSSSLIYFTIAVTDSVPPVLTSTLTNASYKTSSPVLFNISSNENLVWAGYSINGSVIANLSSISSILWNGTLTGFVSGSTNTLVVYGNDSSGNQGNSTIIFYFDNQSPQFSSVSATSVNENQNANCSAYVTDSFSLNSVKIAENATGSFVNHTIDLFATGYANYTILNVAKGNYTCIFYAIDAAGNINSTSTNFGVADVTAPMITIINPQNQTYNTDNISLSVVTSEAAFLVRYSIDDNSNVSMTNSSTTIWSGNLTSLSDGLHTVVYYANDSSGNLGIANISFSVDITLNDNAKPIITIWSPLNGTYYTSASTLLNITSDKNLSWAGYRNATGSLVDLGNVSLVDWNKTITLTEGEHIIEFYANDTSTNKNQGSRNVTIYTDLNNPAVSSFICNSSVNASKNLTCVASVSDAMGLNYAILSYNFSGSFVNSSEIDLTGTSASVNYLFTEGNYTPGSYSVQLFLVDLSGRTNDSSSSAVQVLDDTNPLLSGISYTPTDFNSLDPGVNVTVNASVSDDYIIGSVEVYYSDDNGSSWNSELMTNTSLIEYNSTLIGLAAGNWTFYINATDAQGNTNISANYSFEVALDVSQDIVTNISSIVSFTYAQRTSSNELGYIILNTTSDSSLDYNVTISADSELSRFNLNNTLNQTENYTALSGTVLYVPLYVNLTGLTSGLYPFNITVTSAAGTEVIERNLNVQSASGPYLSVSIDTYSSRVTRGEDDVTFSATVINLGTADAQNVYLNWSLPEGFNLVSGNLVSGPATLGVGSSGSNLITINVSSNISDSNLTVIALASSTNADSANASKVVAITNPLTVTQVVEVPGPSVGGGSGGASANGGGKSIVYSNNVEVVRGNNTGFIITFGNKYSNQTLENISVELTGFPAKYLKISPSFIERLAYGQNGSFEVFLSAPSYKSYEEYTIKAVIKGTLVSATGRESYVETQNIKLVIQEISKEESFVELSLAEEAINSMKERGFNIIELEQLYSQARQKLESDEHNKESYDISSKVIKLKETAFEARRLIDLIRQILQNPKDINLLAGNVVKSDTTQNTIFYSSAIEDVLNMADAAFDRGDYVTALERAKKADLLLRLEQKGNLFIFVYLYWPQILFVLIILVISLRIAYSQYSKRRISSQIRDYDVEEDNLNKFVADNQKNYYSGKISSVEYHNRLSQYNNRLAIIRKSRINLRNVRVKTLSAEQFDSDLNNEKKEVEKEIIKIQEDFYKEKKIPESNYRTGFELLNNRLAEIEDEKLIVDINKEKRNVKPKESWFSFLDKHNERKEQELKRKVDELLKSKGVKK